jgi:hypothetical protein
LQAGNHGPLNDVPIKDASDANGLPEQGFKELILFIDPIKLFKIVQASPFKVVLLPVPLLEQFKG